MPVNQNIQNLLKEIEKECDRLSIENIKIYDIGSFSHLADCVLVATASHILQLEAARRQLSQIMKAHGFRVRTPIEDYSEGWLVLNTVEVLVHILVPEKRVFYDLDGLMDSFILSSLSSETVSI